MISTLWLALVDWLANGLWASATVSHVVAATLVLTHITIASVTIFLHRAQAHRALDLGPVPSHFFRFWLWLTTGMVTREWVAIHRKHHAKCETADDPHSPVAKGIRTVLLRGSELYRAEAKNAQTLAKYGHHTPDDWIERHLYARYSMLGIGLMLAIDLALFGAIGATVWAVQMLWIPITAAGVVNGLGHSLGQALRVRHRLDLHPRARGAGLGQGAQDAAAASARRGQAGGRFEDARGDHRQPLRGDGRVREGAARGLRRRAGAGQAPWRRARGRVQARTALAAPRCRAHPGAGDGAARRRAARQPETRQAAGDARGTASAVDPHQRLGRAAGGRPPGLVQAGRGERHRRAAGIRPRAACGARRVRIGPAGNEKARRWRALLSSLDRRVAAARSLQLDFLVQHVLARLGVEFHEFELAGRGLLVLGHGVKMAGAGRRFELDLLASAFGCHRGSPSGVGRDGGSELAARTQVGDHLLDADLVDQAQRRVGHAQPHPAVLALEPEPARLQVGQPAPLGLVVGVRDVVSHHRALARDLTDACHDAAPGVFDVAGARREPCTLPACVQRCRPDEPGIVARFTFTTARGSAARRARPCSRCRPT